MPLKSKMGSGLPEIQSGDASKVLAVKNDESGAEWIEPPEGGGRTILSGTVDPTTEGVDGDFYINTATTTLFGPKNVTWPTGVSLVGPAGADGAGIPAISEGDSGKVLAVKSDESGAEWVTAPSGGGVSLGMVIALGGD